jgi:hypothetical protein
VQVALLQQGVLKPSLHAFAEQKAIGRLLSYRYWLSSCCPRAGERLNQTHCG